MINTKPIKGCGNRTIHEHLVAKARQSMPDDEALYELADLFRVFGDSTRIRILHALMSSEMCVCDISFLLGMTESAISHQLRVLRQTRMVTQRKAGRVVYYSIADDHIKTILKCGLDHMVE
ncbi:MAG: metalloregulator ArsR/SmtB family transcription factor [Smithellaceae bacterium]